MDSNFLHELKKTFQSERDLNSKAIIGGNIWQHYYTMGSQFLKNNDYNSAIKQLLKAFEYRKYVGQEEISALLLAMGVAYEKLEDYENAIKYYKKILDYYDLDISEKATALEFIGQSYEKSGDNKNAIEFYQKRFSLSPPTKVDWYLMYRFAHIAYENQDYQLAEEYYKYAIKFIPDDQIQYRQRAMQNLAHTYRKLGQNRLEIKYYKIALENQSDIKNITSELYCGLAGAHLRMSKYRKVIKYANDAIKNPHDDETLEQCLFLIAFGYSALGNEDKSQEYSKQLLTLNPKSRFFNDLI